MMNSLFLMDTVYEKDLLTSKLGNATLKLQRKLGKKEHYDGS